MKYVLLKYFGIAFCIVIVFTVLDIGTSLGNIQSSTEVECMGSFDESKHYVANTVVDTKHKNIIYINEIHSISGKIKITDSFWSVQSDNATNLYVTQLIKYTANNDNSTGLITGYEKVGLGVFDCGDNSFYSFATGSSYNTFTLLNKTNTLVETGDKPSLNYDLQSEGESYGDYSTPYGALKTGVEATVSDGEDSENYSEHYNISGYFKISKSIKFAK